VGAAVEAVAGVEEEAAEAEAEAAALSASGV